MSRRRRRPQRSPVSLLVFQESSTQRPGPRRRWQTAIATSSSATVTTCRPSRACVIACGPTGWCCCPQSTEVWKIAVESTSAPLYCRRASSCVQAESDQSAPVIMTQHLQAKHDRTSAPKRQALTRLLSAATCEAPRWARNDGSWSSIAVLVAACQHGPTHTVQSMRGTWHMVQIHTGCPRRQGHIKTNLQTLHEMSIPPQIAVGRDPSVLHVQSPLAMVCFATGPAGRCYNP